MQVAAISLHRAGSTEPPARAEAWADLLRALTPGHPDDAPWCLVAPHDRPALLQAPAAGDALKWFGRSQTAIETPDGLEQAVLPLMSRNHDVKNSCVIESEADDWLFSLVDVQTMSSYSIKYPGVVRMGSGTGTRTCFTIRPPGGVGAWFMRDVRSLATAKPDERPGLVWLQPWTGKETIPIQDLHPFFIEICRQIRLIIHNHRITALQRGDARPRVGDKSTRDRLRGVVGDPWLPIKIGSRNQRDNRDLPTAIALRGSGLGYDLLVKMLDPALVKLARLALIRSDDADEGLYFYACAAAHHYKQSKTEGYHERRIPIAKAIKRLLSVGAADQIAAAGHARADLVGKLSYRVLRPALHCLLRDGKEVERLTPKQSENLDRQAVGWLDLLDHEVDANFFSDLWREFETEDGAERERIRDTWLQHLIARAGLMLEDACRAVPLASIHRYRARTRAKGLFWYLARKQFPQLYPETTDATAAA